MDGCPDIWFSPAGGSPWLGELVEMTGQTNSSTIVSVLTGAAGSWHNHKQRERSFTNM